MSNAQPTVMLIVRGLKSKLSHDELERRYKERMPQFRDVPGLLQKYYSYDSSTEEWAGIYLWESEESAAAYLESDLRKSIPFRSSTCCEPEWKAGLRTPSRGVLTLDSGPRGALQGAP